MDQLLSRVERFLACPLPPGERAEGNATIRLIARYTTDKRWHDPQLRRLAAGCVSALEEGLPGMPEPKRAYYAEAVAILQEILNETVGRPKEKGKTKGDGAGA